MQSCTKMKAMQESCWVAHVPWGQGKVAASSATITCLGPLATESEKKEQDLHSHSPSLFLQMQILRFSDCFYAFLCFITANICRRHSVFFWATSSLNLDSPFTLFCFAFLFIRFTVRVKGFLSPPSPQGGKPDRFDLMPSLFYCHCNKPTLISQGFHHRCIPDKFTCAGVNGTLKMLESLRI